MVLFHRFSVSRKAPNNFHPQGENIYAAMLVWFMVLSAKNLPCWEAVPISHISSSYLLLHADPLQ